MSFDRVRRLVEESASEGYTTNQSIPVLVVLLEIVNQLEKIEKRLEKIQHKPNGVVGAGPGQRDRI